MSRTNPPSTQLLFSHWVLPASSRSEVNSQAFQPVWREKGKRWPHTQLFLNHDCILLTACGTELMPRLQGSLSSELSSEKSLVQQNSRGFIAMRRKHNKNFKAESTPWLYEIEELTAPGEDFLNRNCQRTTYEKIMYTWSCKIIKCCIASKLAKDRFGESS